MVVIMILNDIKHTYPHKTFYCFIVSTSLTHIVLCGSSSIIEPSLVTENISLCPTGLPILRNTLLHLLHRKLLIY